MGLILAACCGGTVRDASLPTGVFSNSSGDQTVTVSEGQVAFHIQLTGTREGQVFDRAYKYRLRGDRLEPYPVRDVDAVFGIGAFTWRWDGERIEQHDRSTGALLQEFARGR